MRYMWKCRYGVFVSLYDLPFRWKPTKEDLTMSTVLETRHGFSIRWGWWYLTFVR